MTSLANHRSHLRSLTMTLALVVAGATAGAQAPREQGRLGLRVEQITDTWTGDLDGMVERRLIRVLTVYSRTQYFVDRGVPRGTAYDEGKLLEEALNKKLGPGQLKVSVQFVPVSRDELIPWLLQGRLRPGFGSASGQNSTYIRRSPFDAAERLSREHGKSINDCRIWRSSRSRPSFR